MPEKERELGMDEFVEHFGATIAAKTSNDRWTVQDIVEFFRKNGVAWNKKVLTAAVRRVVANGPGKDTTSRKRVASTKRGTPAAPRAPRARVPQPAPRSAAPRVPRSGKPANVSGNAHSPLRTTPLRPRSGGDSV